ncbi:hypothetical protein J1N35_006976 [Gossypium stocksii]|uniref:Uncharacterized protein n=1 Tax=Gossypium stocksii TaxID=47602 RepID=A0A9D3W7P0_9ROSI|nr:hypothetical protein J1N35_006976 [Gossypium stocksii]
MSVIHDLFGASRLVVILNVLWTHYSSYERPDIWLLRASRLKALMSFLINGSPELPDIGSLELPVISSYELPVNGSLELPITWLT